MTSATYHWVEFTTLIEGTLKVPLPLKRLSETIKMPGYSLVEFRQIDAFFREEFSLHAYGVQRQKWHDKEKAFLVWCVSKLVHHFAIEFHELERYHCFEIISKAIGYETDFLREKWLSLLRQNCKKNPFSRADDDLLHKLKVKYPGNKQWTQLALEFNLKQLSCRSQKQLRERWNNVLDPSIVRESFSDQETLKLLKCALEQDRRWSQIGRHLTGRNDNAIKNHYYSVMRRLCKLLNLEFSSKEDDLLKLIVTHQTLDLTLLSELISAPIHKHVKVEDPITPPSRLLEIHPNRIFTPPEQHLCYIPILYPFNANFVYYPHPCAYLP